MDIQTIMKEAHRRLNFIGDPATRKLISQLLDVMSLQAAEIERLQLEKLCEYLKDDTDLPFK